MARYAVFREGRSWSWECRGRKCGQIIRRSGFTTIDAAMAEVTELSTARVFVLSVASTKSPISGPDSKQANTQE